MASTFDIAKHFGAQEHMFYNKPNSIYNLFVPTQKKLYQGDLITRLEQFLNGRRVHRYLVVQFFNAMLTIKNWTKTGQVSQKLHHYVWFLS